MPTGNQIARSRALGVIAFMTTATAIRATTTQIATGNHAVGTGDQTSNPARWRTTRATPVQTTAATALVMRNCVVSSAR